MNLWFAVFEWDGQSPAGEVAHGRKGSSCEGWWERLEGVDAGLPSQRSVCERGSELPHRAVVGICRR